MEDLVLEEHWNSVFDSRNTTGCITGFTGSAEIGWSTLVARISCQLRWERRWTGVISEVEHEQEVLACQADGDVHGHPDQEMSLGSTGYISEDEDQVNDREDVGFQNNRDHQNE